MRQGPNSRRSRGRGGNNPGRRSNLPNRNQTFDSNGPDVRIRGNAHQVFEKYQALARDASASGDRVTAENYLQHAEHYHRIINAMNDAYTQAQQQQFEQSGRDQNDRDQNDRGDDGRDAPLVNGRDHRRDAGPPGQGGPRPGRGGRHDQVASEDDLFGDPRQSDDQRGAGPADEDGGERVARPERRRQSNGRAAAAREDQVAGRGYGGEPEGGGEDRHGLDRIIRAPAPASAEEQAAAPADTGAEAPAKPRRRPGRPRKAAAEAAPAPESGGDSGAE